MSMKFIVARQGRVFLLRLLLMTVARSRWPEFARDLVAVAQTRSRCSKAKIEMHHVMTGDRRGDCRSVADIQADKPSFFFAATLSLPLIMHQP